MHVDHPPPDVEIIAELVLLHLTKAGHERKELFSVVVKDRLLKTVVILKDEVSIHTSPPIHAQPVLTFIY